MINAGPTVDPAANPRSKPSKTRSRKLEQTAAERKARPTLRAAAVAEEEGSAGTGVAGCAAMCVEKKRLADEAEARWQQTLDEIAAKEREKDDIVRGLEGSLLEESEKAIADARAELPGVEAKADQLREQIRNAQDTSHALEEANTGIIARLKALDDLSANSPTASAAHMMVALLFMCIEILPVLFKVLSNFGSPTAYDNVLETFEGEEVRTATAEVSNRQLISDLRQNAALDAEKKRIDKQQQTILRSTKPSWTIRRRWSTRRSPSGRHTRDARPPNGSRRGLPGWAHRNRPMRSGRLWDGRCDRIGNTGWIHESAAGAHHPERSGGAPGSPGEL